MFFNCSKIVLASAALFSISFATKFLRSIIPFATVFIDVTKAFPASIATCLAAKSEGSWPTIFSAENISLSFSATDPWSGLTMFSNWLRIVACAVENENPELALCICKSMNLSNALVIPSILTPYPAVLAICNTSAEDLTSLIGASRLA